MRCSHLMLALLVLGACKGGPASGGATLHDSPGSGYEDPGASPTDPYASSGDPTPTTNELVAACEGRPDISGAAVLDLIVEGVCARATRCPQERSDDTPPSAAGGSSSGNTYDWTDPGSSECPDQVNLAKAMGNLEDIDASETCSELIYVRQALALRPNCSLFAVPSGVCQSMFEACIRDWVAAPCKLNSVPAACAIIARASSGGAGGSGAGGSGIGGSAGSPSDAGVGGSDASTGGSGGLGGGGTGGEATGGFGGASGESGGGGGGSAGSAGGGDAG